MDLLLYDEEFRRIIKNKKYSALGRIGNKEEILKRSDLILLPEGAQIYYLPQKQALGYDLKNKVIKKFKNFPICALLPPGYLRTYLPAYKSIDLSILPFFGYTALTWERDFYTGAVKIEDNYRWNIFQYNSLDLKNKIKQKLKEYPKNRILKHLSYCALNYRCLTAQNIFYERWEGGIPTTSKCNAGCFGCISSQSKGRISPQNRLNFMPGLEEILEIMLNHLNKNEAIISFGQGCEGEPSLNYLLLGKAINKVRARVSTGIININTNGGNTLALRELFKAGLDSLRISLNSANPEHYKRYYLPKNYDFKDIEKTIELANSSGKFVSLNLLVLPGITDQKEELDFLRVFLKRHKINFLQLRNLNIDPEFYFKEVYPSKESLGINNWLNLLKKQFPALKIGSFNPYIK
ncbi:MAG: radical SAM protein [Armatimonadetes bacterium]|nr:radical SAM protein [Armatimonadota bacterium]